jgi:hypothetical protein
LLFGKFYTGQTKGIFFILSFAILLMLSSLIQAQFVIATSKSPYESGYDHGCDDADISDPDDRYINQPEKGPDFHTNEFMGGYNDGYDACSGIEDGTGRTPSTDVVQDFCSALRRGDYSEAEDLLLLTPYRSISIAAKVFCGIVILAE